MIIVVAAVLMILITLLTPQISQLIIDKVIYPALGQPLEQQNDSILVFWWRVSLPIITSEFA